MLVTAAAFVWGAVLVSLIRRVPERRAEERRTRPSRAAAFLREVGRGVQEQSRATVVFASWSGLYAAQTLLAGALGVLVVVTAFELLQPE